jgi:hypothetical protein
MSIGKEIDEAIERAKKASQRESDIKSALSKDLQIIWESYDKVFWSDGLIAGSYTIGKTFISLDWRGKKALLFQDTQDKKKKRWMKILQEHHSSVDSKYDKYQIDGDELYIQEIMPIWAEILKELALHIAQKKEISADMVEGKREAGLHLLDKNKK